MDIRGEPHVVEGSLVIGPCDTLASHWLGGFKEGVAFALRNCRHCEVESNTMKGVFHASQVQMRTNSAHKERFIPTNSPAKQYWSKLWGPLVDLDGFSLIDGLVQNPMHVLYEGTFPNELVQILYQFIFVEKFFTLAWLNTAIPGFPYS